MHIVIIIFKQFISAVNAVASAFYEIKNTYNDGSLLTTPLISTKCFLC